MTALATKHPKSPLAPSLSYGVTRTMSHGVTELLSLVNDIVLLVNHVAPSLGVASWRRGVSPRVLGRDVAGVPVRGWGLAAAGAALMTVTPANTPLEETESVK